mmetsp:Transcript_23777/g.59664  ORF Transcript_23777/g.59664 Transcript_23777/m.59664 type:complete len:204 (-) Transcript_23777:1095-1706(-)
MCRIHQMPRNSKWVKVQGIQRRLPAPHKHKHAQSPLLPVVECSSNGRALNLQLDNPSFKHLNLSNRRTAHLLKDSKSKIDHVESGWSNQKIKKIGCVKASEDHGGYDEKVRNEEDLEEGSTNSVKRSNHGDDKQNARQRAPKVVVAKADGPCGEAIAKAPKLEVKGSVEDHEQKREPSNDSVVPNHTFKTDARKKSKRRITRR